MQDLLARRDLWFSPLLLEASIAGAAGALAIFFHLVITQQPYAPALATLAGFAAIGGLLKFWINANELFMPRPVVVLMVGPMAAACGVVAAVVLTTGSGAEHVLSLPARLVVVLPLCLFALRTVFNLRKARFAPRVDSVHWRTRAGENRLAAKLRETLGFWFE
jgi:hypothetical protein